MHWVKFCGAFELALRGHDESEQADNPGIFCGLIDFASGIENAVKEHTQNSAMFKHTYETIQNKPLDCMLKIYQQMIKKC
jgi:hypothetical protein